jgi:hypothetical protein
MAWYFAGSVAAESIAVAVLIAVALAANRYPGPRKP